MTALENPLLCVDAPALLYRAFHALPDSIRGRDGISVNALLGSVNALVQVVREHKPRAVVICFGAEAAEYRTTLYPAYHADRPPMPDPLSVQWELAPELYRSFGWFVVDTFDFEADDLLGSFARAEEEAGGNTLILTGDRDMFQCVDDYVHVLLQGGGTKGAPTEITATEVEARYGIPPALVPDFIALRGDPSDGIPGAKGIGAKTASELLRRHGSLEECLSHAIRERPAIRRSLLEQGDELQMFKKMATLEMISVERPPDTETDWTRGSEACLELGLVRLGERLRDVG